MYQRLALATCAVVYAYSRKSLIKLTKHRFLGKGHRIFG